MADKKKDNLKSQVESILLVAEKPVSAKEAAACLGASKKEVQKVLDDLHKEYEGKGIIVAKNKEEYSIATNPENGEVVTRFLNEELRHDLSEASVETLSIITYKQPVTRIEIEEIRGVAADQILRNLLMRGLIAEVGRKDAPGRPILYGTTMEFMNFFGFKNEGEIPTFEEPRLSGTESGLPNNIDNITA